MLAGLGMFSINSLSSHLQTLRSYLDTLALSALGVMLWRVGVDLQFRGPHYHYWIIALMLIFWLVLRQAGRRLHMTHHKNFELQYRNNQLIESLTRQTRPRWKPWRSRTASWPAPRTISGTGHALSLYADWLGSEPELVHEITPKIVESTKAVNALFDSLFDLVRPGLWQDQAEHRVGRLVQAAATTSSCNTSHWPSQGACSFEFTSIPAPWCRTRSCCGASWAPGLQRGEVHRARRVLLASRVTRTGRCIEVWDTGVGIAPVHQREIFREFYKVPAMPEPRRASAWACTSWRGWPASWGIRSAWPPGPAAARCSG